MGNLYQDLAKCKHPNSRKTKALAKKAKRMNNKHKNRLGHAIKSNLIGEKLTWFLDRLNGRIHALNPQEFDELIELYLKRFEEELNQIELKQSISKNRSNQHAARKDVLKITLENEIAQYNGGGLELVNLCDSEKFKSLLQWDGNAINIQHLKLDLISKSFLKRLKEQQNHKESNK